jgi:hypothetical protein
MKNYIILVANKAEYKRDSLKQARNLVRSLLNVNEVKGIAEKIEIYKEVTKRKKIDEVTSNPANVGSFDKVFGQ